MILRPVNDTSLLDLIAKILSDESITLDVRAMLAVLLTRRDLENCPFLSGLAEIIGPECGSKVGQFRIGRMVKDAVAAGYMIRASWRVPRIGRRPAYSFVLGSKGEIADIKPMAAIHG